MKQAILAFVGALLLVGSYGAFSLLMAGAELGSAAKGFAVIGVPFASAALVASLLSQSLSSALHISQFLSAVIGGVVSGVMLGLCMLFLHPFSTPSPDGSIVSGLVGYAVWGLVFGAVVMAAGKLAPNNSFKRTRESRAPLNSGVGL